MLDGVEVAIFSVGERLGQVAVDAEKLALKFGQHVAAPEVGRAGDQIVGRFERAQIAGYAEKVVGFLELGVEEAKFVRIIRRGHLSEVVGRGDTTADDLFGGGAEGDRVEIGSRSGAADGVEDDVQPIGAKSGRGQVAGGHGAAAQHVGVGVLRPGARGVGSQFEIARVVQDDRGEAAFELPGGEGGLGRSFVAGGEEFGEAEGRLQRVVKIVIPQIDRLIVEVATFKHRLHIREKPVQHGDGIPGIEPTLNLLDRLGDCDRVGGVGEGEHAARRGRCRGRWFGNNYLLETRASPFSNRASFATVMILGLTGGMGSGKSTAARMFSEHGLQRLDSDAVVREEILTSSDVIAAVERRFGSALLGADGGIDRGRLAARVFADDAEREWLEGEVHPRLYAIWRSRLAADRGASWVIEVPLLFEKRLENWFDFTVCVATSSPVQLARLEERGVPRALAEQRISKQLPLAQKLELADYVLLNDGDVEFLHAQIVHLLRHLRG